MNDSQPTPEDFEEHVINYNGAAHDTDCPCHQCASWFTWASSRISGRCGHCGRPIDDGHELNKIGLLIGCPKAKTA